MSVLHTFLIMFQKNKKRTYLFCCLLEFDLYAGNLLSYEAASTCITLHGLQFINTLGSTIHLKSSDLDWSYSNCMIDTNTIINCIINI